MDHALLVRGVRKSFPSRAATVRALRGVDLDVGTSEFVAAMGPSGCGKSTLLNLVAGVDVPDAGEVHLAGIALGTRGEDERARIRRQHVGFVFQFFNLLDGMTASENVELAAVVAGASRTDARERARGLLDLLGLTQWAGELPDVLSGGERQRLAIARALANEPTLLLADEPTGALDSSGGMEVLELFRRLHADGQAILLVTHDERVAAVADRVLRMRDGRVEQPEPALEPRLEA
jgi:putative ABC transport system ATP-binding protein